MYQQRYHALLCLVGLNYRSKYGRGALPSTHGVPHDSAAKKAKLHTGLISKSLWLSIRAMKIMIPARVRPRSYWAPFGLGSSSTRVELRVGLRSGWSLIVVNQCVFNETSDVSLGSRCSLENAAPSKCHAGQKGKAFLGSKAKRLFFARSRFFPCYCIRDPFHMKSTDRGLKVGNHWPFCYCQSQDDLMRELMTCLERAFYMFRAKSFYSLAKSLRFFRGWWWRGGRLGNR